MITKSLLKFTKLYTQTNKFTESKKSLLVNFYSYIYYNILIYNILYIRNR